jgi:hypothetical protein
MSLQSYSYYSDYTFLENEFMIFFRKLFKEKIIFAKKIPLKKKDVAFWKKISPKFFLTLNIIW